MEIYDCLPFNMRKVLQLTAYLVNQEYINLA